MSIQENERRDRMVALVAEYRDRVETPRSVRIRKERVEARQETKRRKVIRAFKYAGVTK